MIFKRFTEAFSADGIGADAFTQRTNVLRDTRLALSSSLFKELTARAEPRDAENVVMKAGNEEQMQACHSTLEECVRRCTEDGRTEVVEETLRLLKDLHEEDKVQFVSACARSCFFLPLFDMLTL